MHYTCPLLALLSALMVVREISSSPDDQCQFIFKVDAVLDVRTSQNNGAKVMEDLHVDDKFKCAEACCSSKGEWCTLAVFHTHAGPEALNCFLVKCVPDGSIDGQSVCVTNHHRHSGFITATVKHHIPTQKAPESATDQPTTHVQSKTTTQPEEDVTTPTIKLTSPVSLAANQTSDSNATQPITAALNRQNETSKTIVEEANNNNINRTTVTQTGVLIVTLCFGLIFLLAMIVVVGKRWTEGYQRRQYSKVDYLINDIYS